MKAERSLKSRALQLLAQRDQSRLELRRKLLRHARGRDVDPEAADEVDPAAVAAEVDALLDWLEANRFLSNARFAESRVHARAARFGLQRIRSELAQHAVELPAELAQALAASEIDRAAAVRERRFSRPPADAAERAAQSRFLLGRGFAPELVQRLMRKLGRPAAGAGDGAQRSD
ncbi:MAG TPA: RecX family transcriptional regulator [Caldimonas sp.]|nr:RecX family transcriptional regulator [Caldimonas sp.]HEV7575873.1 RecX family transcriptional regulator [Caldimonas sp.]